MTKLVWKANGVTDQPAGMIHYGYPQYAVTFIDNHDTYHDDWNKFKGNVVAANAFMLCSPGTPCVFLPHWKQYKSEIKQLIAIRNSVGVSNTSAVKVLQSSGDCYMAEVTGSKGKLVVKVGSAMVSPSGYSNSDIKASGNSYCVWTKTPIVGGNGQGTGDDPGIDPNPGGNAPSQLYLLGNVKGAQWSTSSSPAMTKNGNKFTISSVTMETAAGETMCYFNLSDALGADWDALNAAANRYGSASEGENITVGGSATMVEYATTFQQAVAFHGL